jgi:hypothetical protein
MSSLEALGRSSGDHDIVWEVLYAYDYYHRVDDGEGYGDTRPAGKTREQEVMHIIAPTIAAAKLAFTHRHWNYEAVSFTPLCTVNHTIRL